MSKTIVNTNLLSDEPKLYNAYNDSFEYKNKYQKKELSSQFHAKILQYEKNISKLRKKKSEDKNNLIKIKINLKEKRNFALNSTRIDSKKQIQMYKDKIFELKTFISFKDILKSKISEIKKESKNNFVLTKKTINSLKVSDNSEEVIISKIETFYNEGSVLENKLLIKNIFLKKVLENFDTKSLEENNVIDNFDCDISDLVIDSNLKDFYNANKEVFNQENANLLSNLIQQFQKQKFFLFNEEERQKQIIDYTEKIAEIKLNRKEKTSSIKADFKTKFLNEKTTVLNEFKIHKQDFKNKLNSYKEKISSLKEAEKAYISELKLEEKNTQRRIRDIKVKHKKLYKENLKELSIQNKEATKEKQEKEYKSLFNLLTFQYCQPVFWEMTFFEKKYFKKQAQAKYLIDLGEELKELSYDGDYLSNKGLAIRNASQFDFDLKNNFIKDFNSQNDVYQNLKLSYNESKKNFKAEISKIKKEFTFFKKQNKQQELAAFVFLCEKKLDEIKANTDTNNEFVVKKIYSFYVLEKNKLENLKLKEQYKEKTISKEALKNQIKKNKILAREEIKSISLRGDFQLASFKRKELVIKYAKNRKTNIENYQQNINKITNQIPIEVKANTSIWLTIMAFILPGSESFVLKRWKKAILLTILTVIVFGLLLPYSFGAYNIKGQGLIGLTKLCWIDSNTGKPVDSRFVLIEGVIGLFTFFITFIYMSVNAIITFRSTRLMESGTRVNAWFQTKKTLKGQGFPYLISVPGWILILFIVIMPVVVSILIAFTNMGKDHDPAFAQDVDWVGFDNFIRLFNNPAFYSPLGYVFLWNIIWAVATTVLVLFLGTLMAVLIESRGIKGKKVFRLIFMLPWAIPAFVTILFYKVIFDYDNGFINNTLLDWGLISEKIDWMKGSMAPRIILILIQGWLGHSYIVLLVTGNMKSISGDIYEAATIDGANKNKQFWSLTTPIVLAQIAPLLIGQFLFNFNNFSIIWMFNGGGANIDIENNIYAIKNCDLILSWIFNLTMGGSSYDNPVSHLGLGSAMVIIMSIVVVSASAISFSKTKAFKRGGDV